MIVRNLKEEDKALLADLIAADLHHQDSTQPDFFFRDGTKCLVYESEDQEHQMFVRLSNSLRLDIQFNNDDKVFNAKTILTAFPRLKAWAKQKGFSEIVFDSQSLELIAFLTKRFGFRKEANEYRLDL